MSRRRIVIEDPPPIRLPEKIRDLYDLARVGMGALRIRRFIRRKPVLCSFIGLGAGFFLARLLGSRR